MLTPPHTIRPWPLPRASSPLIDAAREALAAIPDTQQREERAELIYKELTATGTPLVENTLVTFVWYGDAPHGVILNLNKVTDMPRRYAAGIHRGDRAARPHSGYAHRVDGKLQLQRSWF